MSGYDLTVRWGYSARPIRSSMNPEKENARRWENIGGRLFGG
jgi:hypothetical protein